MIEGGLNEALKYCIMQHADELTLGHTTFQNVRQVGCALFDGDIGVYRESANQTRADYCCCAMRTLIPAWCTS